MESYNWPKGWFCDGLISKEGLGPFVKCKMPVKNGDEDLVGCTSIFRQTQ